MTQYSSLLRGLAAGSAFLFLFAPTAFAAEQTVEAPSVDARAWILMDYASGKVLAEGNADEKLDPASLTKIMTSYVVGQALKADKIKLTDMVTVGKDAWATGNPALRGSALLSVWFAQSIHFSASARRAGESIHRRFCPYCAAR